MLQAENEWRVRVRLPVAEKLNWPTRTPRCHSGNDDEDLFDSDDDEDDFFGEEDDDDAENLPGELWTREYEKLQRRRAEEQHHSDPVHKQQVQRQAIVVQQAQLQEEEEREGPRVLSALTTTQTNRAADGTVTTKVVLKRRFADGSEETHEKSHTFNDNDVGAEQPITKTEEKEKQAKGWFWS